MNQQQPGEKLTPRHTTIPSTIRPLITGKIVLHFKDIILNYIFKGYTGLGGGEPAQFESRLPRQREEIHIILGDNATSLTLEYNPDTGTVDIIHNSTIICSLTKETHIILGREQLDPLNNKISREHVYIGFKKGGIVVADYLSKGRTYVKMREKHTQKE